MNYALLFQLSSASAGGGALAGDATQLTDILKVGLDHLLQSEER